MLRMIKAVKQGPDRRTLLPLINLKEITSVPLFIHSDNQSYSSFTYLFLLCVPAIILDY